MGPEDNEEMIDPDDGLLDRLGDDPGFLPGSLTYENPGLDAHVDIDHDELVAYIPDDEDFTS